MSTACLTAQYVPIFTQTLKDMRHSPTPINFQPKVCNGLCISLIISMSENFGFFIKELEKTFLLFMF